MVSRRAPIADRLAGRSEQVGACLIYTYGTSTRAGHVQVFYDGRRHFVHRVAYRLAYGPFPDGFSVLHSCDTPRCIEPAHLRLGTIADNNADMVRRGRLVVPRGSKSGMAVLTEAKAEQILLGLAHGETLKALGERFEVHLSTIWLIKAGRTWAHVRPDLARAA